MGSYKVRATLGKNVKDSTSESLVTLELVLPVFDARESSEASLQQRNVLNKTQLILRLRAQDNAHPFQKTYLAHRATIGEKLGVLRRGIFLRLIFASRTLMTSREYP